MRKIKWEMLWELLEGKRLANGTKENDLFSKKNIKRYKSCKMKNNLSVSSDDEVMVKCSKLCK